MINYDITLWIYVYINIRTLVHSMLPSAISHSVSSYTHSSHTHSHVHTFLLCCNTHYAVRPSIPHNCIFACARHPKQNSLKSAFFVPSWAERRNERKKARHHPHENEEKRYQIHIRNIITQSHPLIFIKFRCVHGYRHRFFSLFSLHFSLAHQSFSATSIVYCSTACKI